MYYACFDLPGMPVDIFAFKSKADRDDWVNFLDDFSIGMETPEDCVFKRKALDTPEELLFAETRIQKCKKLKTKKIYKHGAFLTAIDKHRPLVVKDVCLPNAVLYLSSYLEDMHLL